MNAFLRAIRLSTTELFICEKNAVFGLFFLHFELVANKNYGHASIGVLY
jgi:hypothetical protein